MRLILVKCMPLVVFNPPYHSECMYISETRLATSLLKERLRFSINFNKINGFKNINDALHCGTCFAISGVIF